MNKNNPWNNIQLSDYENHMQSDNVQQLQTLNRIMKEQIDRYPICSLSILGIAGGNGLEHVNSYKIKQVYGIDINNSYLEVCKGRYPYLSDVFIGMCIDLSNPKESLPESELVIANLFIEYVGLDIFTSKLKEAHPNYVSCVIQENRENQFVSNSPYEDSLNTLANIHIVINKEELISSMKKIKYIPTLIEEYHLPNGKLFHRIDFELK